MLVESHVNKMRSRYKSVEPWEILPEVVGIPLNDSITPGVPLLGGPRPAAPLEGPVSVDLLGEINAISVPEDVDAFCARLSRRLSLYELFSESEA